jgi:hypothetical protein
MIFQNKFTRSFYKLDRFIATKNITVQLTNCLPYSKIFVALAPELKITADLE